MHAIKKRLLWQTTHAILLILNVVGECRAEALLLQVVTVQVLAED